MIKPFPESFKSLLTLGLMRPRLALWSVVSLVACALGLITLGPLEISTSRRGLVSLSSPHQARLFRYYEEFGRSELAVLVVTGGKPEARRRIVDHFSADLERAAQFHDRVLGRITLDEVAETLFLWWPGLLERLSARDAERGDPWLNWTRALTERITAQLDSGEEPANAAQPEDTQQLERLVRALAALRHAVQHDGRVSVAGLGLGTGEAQVDEQGYLAGPGGSYHLALIFPRLASDEGRVVRPVVERIRAARDRALRTLPNSGVRAELTGAPALATDELRSLQAGSRLTSLLSAAGILLVLLWVFRSFRHAVIALIPLLAGIVITLGFVELVYDGLNLVTSSFMSVLMGLGIDFGVHLLHRFREAQAKEGDVPDALGSALLGAGPAVAIGALTTMLAFLTTTTTEFGAFRELGVITSVGLLVVLGCAFLLFPGLLLKVGGRRQVSMRELPGVAGALGLVQRRPRWLIGAAAVTTLLGLLSLWWQPPGFNGRYFDFLPEHAESYRALGFLQQHAGPPPAEAHFAVASVSEARKLALELRALPEVGQVQSPSDLLPPETPERIAAVRAAVQAAGNEVPRLGPVMAEQARARLVAFTELADAFDELAFALRQTHRNAGPATRASREISALRRWLEQQPALGTEALRRVTQRLNASFERASATAKDVARRGAYAPSDLPALFQARFASKDGTRLALHANPAGDVWAPGFADRFATAVRALDQEAAGVALNIVPHQRYIIEGFQRAAGYSLLLISFVLWFAFRRASDVLFAMLPVLLAWIWMLGAMRPLGIEFTPANMVALPLLLGIGLDAGVHMVHRCRHGQARGGVAELMRGTGAAVGVASITTMVGFGALMAADYRAMQGLGMLLCIGIGFSLLASILVLPALLLVTGRTR